MILCPNCQHKNIAGAIFCAECGSQLVGNDALVTQSIATDQFAEASPPKKGQPPPGVSLGGDTWVSLHLLESGQILPLANRSEFTLGRSSEDQPIMPDVDLTPYQAYACGVSRLHAVLKREGKHVLIVDLGSSNGTYVNGKRLPPNSEHGLKHADVISLGKLQIQVLLK